MTYDCLIIGGGIIGLSTAYELAGEGLSVCVVDRQQPGREASWAGAGILPPMRFSPGDPPINQIAALSFELHPRWAAALREETGIDNGFRRCGAIRLALDEPAADELRTNVLAWRNVGVRVDTLTPDEISCYEPNVTTAVCEAVRLPEQAQFCNPRHLKALVSACQARNVDLLPSVAVEDFEVRKGRIAAVTTNQGQLVADQVCLTAGCWTGRIAQRLGFSPTIKPIRGQMALLNGRAGVLQHIIETGPQYLVPRPDGHVLAGTTVEEVGFDCRTTAAGIGQLLTFATALVPQLADFQLVRSWAGLRPGSIDGQPYLGRLPNLENGWIAAGHFRDGLLLSTGTAVVMSQLIRGVSPDINLEPFRPDRDDR